ncbi:anti-sigma factor family protein [Paenibacillus agricola]|uniref:Zf-HC2 domain-containing protein n=2 Tax=Paenibacillus agricola TaxID=2716264 RepID=A0ABX0J3L6_9BACL|nr:zf-HC2 domain-containing protein [Paenibacillus agricola]
MQRYLDQDLDEFEYKQMLGHLQDCPECTELFQRLLSISEHLENLPKVTPAFSLVDAILPRLQLIDEAPAAVDYGAAAGAAHSSAGTETIGRLAAPTPPKLQVQGQSQARDNKKDSVPVTRLASWRERTKGLISTRIIGGVVAAGLVLGFFMFDRQEQSNMQNADGVLAPTSASSQSRMANKEQANTADSTSGISELKAPAGAPASDSNLSGEAPIEDNKVEQSINENVPHSNVPLNIPKAKEDTNTSSPIAPANHMGSNKIGGSIPEGAVSSGSTTTDSSIAAMPRQTGNGTQQAPSSVPAAGGGELREPATFGTQQEVPSSSGGAPLASQIVPESKLATPAPLQAPSGATGGSSAAKDNAASSSLTEPPKLGSTPAASADSSADANKLKVGSSPAADQGIASMQTADTTSLASLDKQFTGSILDNRVIIKDKNGKALFTSKRVTTDADHVALVEWTTDSKLTYQVSNQAGTKTYVINTANWTESNK